MPVSPPKPCNYPGCPALIKGQRYCDEHAPKQKNTNSKRQYDFSRGTTAQRGYGARWRKLRLLALHRDPVCVRCQRRPTVDIDHIIPKAAGGTDSLDNLQGLCHSCHSAKTAQDKLDGLAGSYTKTVSGHRPSDRD